MGLTVTDAIAKFGVDIDPHLDRDVTIPVNRGLQRQGDVIIVPTPSVRIKGDHLVRAEGEAVVRGENGGNTHLLLADGMVRYQALDTTNARALDVGVMVVTEGATAYLAHPEHGYLAMDEGTYTLRRQREQADEIRMVAD